MFIKYNNLLVACSFGEYAATGNVLQFKQWARLELEKALRLIQQVEYEGEYFPPYVVKTIEEHLVSIKHLNINDEEYSSFFIY